MDISGRFENIEKSASKISPTGAPDTPCFLKVINHSPLATALLNKDLEVFYYNPAARLITSWQFVNSTGHSLLTLAHPDDVGSLTHLIRNCTANPEKPVFAQFRVRHANITYIRLDATITNLLHDPDVDAILINFVAAPTQDHHYTESASEGDKNVSGSLTDINEGREAEVAPRQMSEYLRLLFDNAPDIICIIGSDRHLKKVNHAMCQQLEYTEAELLKLSLDDLVHPDDMAESRRRTKIFIQRGDQILYFENRFLSKNGKPVWLSWTVSRSAQDGLMFCVGKNISDKKELQVLLSKVNELARIGGWEVDRVKGTAYWSPITREIYEVTDEFVPSKDNWLSFYAEGFNRDYIAGKMADLIATGKPCDVEVEMVTARGNKRWVRAVAEAEFIGGECVRVYGSFQDIDKRKTAELAATAALKERDKILESIGDGFFALDRQWITTYWNTAAEKTLGKSRQEMLGQNFWSKYPEVKRSGFYRKYHSAMQTGEAVHFEDYYPPSETWFCIDAYPSENGLSVFFKDITETKHAAKELAESEKRYSDLFHLSPLPKFVYDMATLKYLDVNHAAIAHYGYTREEFLSMTILDIRPAEDIPLLKKTIAEKRDQYSVKLEGLFRHRKKDGSLIRVDIQSNIITYHGVRCKIVLANDVTERVRYIEAIETQNKKLKEIAWMQSHIVRAPLSRIMGLLPMLDLGAAATEEQRLAYEYLVTSANELDDVIRSITIKSNAVDI